MQSLDSIVALYRAPDTLTLWGIPYRMREDVGQQPGDLYRASRWYWGLDLDTRSTRYARPTHDPKRDWIYLGSPGWFGTLKPDEIEAIKAFLAQHTAVIPQGPNEWCYLESNKCAAA